MRSDDVVEVLGLLHFVPQLVPGALQHLRAHTERRRTLYQSSVGITLSFYEKSDSHCGSRPIECRRLPAHSRYVFLVILIIISSAV